MRHWKSACSVGLAFLLSLALASPALAQAKGGNKKSGKKKSQATKSEETVKYDLQALAKLGKEVKGFPGFYEISYKARDGKKKRLVSMKAWIKVEPDTVLLRDAAVKVGVFAEGDPLKIFTKPLETEQSGRGGVGGGRFRVMRATRVVIGGKDVSVNEGFLDPRDEDFIWCDVTVEKAGAAMSVTWSGSPYKLSMDRRSVVLKRVEGELKRDFRPGYMIIVQANTTDRKPLNQKKELPAFKVVRVYVIDQKSLGWYGAFFPFLMQN